MSECQITELEWCKNGHVSTLMEIAHWPLTTFLVCAPINLEILLGIYHYHGGVVVVAKAYLQSDVELPLRLLGAPRINWYHVSRGSHTSGLDSRHRLLRPCSAISSANISTCSTLWELDEDIQSEDNHRSRIESNNRTIQISTPYHSIRMIENGPTRRSLVDRVMLQ